MDDQQADGGAENTDSEIKDIRDNNADSAADTETISDSHTTEEKNGSGSGEDGNVNSADGERVGNGAANPNNVDKVSGEDQQGGAQKPITIEDMSNVKNNRPQAQEQSRHKFDELADWAKTDEPAQQQRPKKSGKGNQILLKLVLGLIIIVLIAVLAISLQHRPVTPKHSTSTTTINQALSVNLGACSIINRPGSYYLTHSISYSPINGNCITIETNNAVLNCRNNSITGSGPFVLGANTSTGVYVKSSNNVSILNCPISKFSYGIRSNDSSNIVISKDNVSYNIESNVYLISTKSSQISNNKMVGTKTSTASLYLASNSTGNNVSHNNISDNEYGVAVNSTGNNYTDNLLSNTKISFYCSLGNGYYNTSAAKSNICSTDYGCSFLSCTTNNIAANISKISLAKSIASCGSIVSPGNYYMNGSIDAYYVMPFGAAWENPLPCINIMSNNVNLYCNNNTISNASVGIFVSHHSNVSINNCRVVSSGTGIYLKNVTGSTITDPIITLSSIGISLNSSNINRIDGFHINKTTRGIFLNESFTNTFEKGSALNNSVDIYAENNSASIGTNLMLQSSCGISDTRWANCVNYISPTLNEFYLNSCGVLAYPGTYILESNVLSSNPNCFTVKANNTKLDCAGHVITNGYFGGSNSSAVYSEGTHFDDIYNCVFDNFNTGVAVNNSVGFDVYNNTFDGSLQHGGILFRNSSDSDIYSNRITEASSFGVSLNNVSYAAVNNNSASYIKSGDGFNITNSRNNTVSSNNATNSYIGISFAGNSTNNTVSLNSMQLSAYSDYVCDRSSSGINSENGGVNYGVSKINCRWLAATQPSTHLQCPVSFKPSSFTLYSDAVYGSGATCFAVYSNDTTINCNNHTVIATDGGTFALFKNGSRDTLENCNLKGFSSPLIAINAPDVKIYNNTISLIHYNRGDALSVIKTDLSQVSYNNISSSADGISLYRDSNGTVNNNMVNASSVSYLINDTDSMTINNNIASLESGIGWLLNDSVYNLFYSNLLYGRVLGAECLGSSTGSASNSGSNNLYNTISGCAWIKS